MAHLISFLKGAAISAGACYLFDPQRGAARRSSLRRHLVEWGADLGDEADRAVVATGQALAGQVQRAGSWLTGEPLCQHAPSAMGDEHLSSPWLSQSRMLGGTLGSLLLVYGLSQRRPLARLAMTAGLGLLAEGLLHHSTSEARPEPARHREEPGAVSPARGQTEEAASPSWKVAVP